MATLAFRRQPAPITAAPAATNTAERLDYVQMLRALAAAMVVLLHVQFIINLEAVRNGLPFERIRAVPLGAGVDLFFVISGFIIVFASERLFATGQRLEFLRRRLLRIVPLFWFALILRMGFLAVADAIGQKPFPDAWPVIASFLFIPVDGMGFGPDYPFPILDLGWSLNYEMLFYALFAALIGFAREKAVLALVGILLAAAILATIAPPANLALRFWTHPITLEFGMGALLALAYRRGVRLGAPARLALLAAGIVWWLVLPLTLIETAGAPGSYSWTRVVTSGIGALLLVAAGTLGTGRVTGRLPQAVLRLGDSSYSLYLIHPFILLTMTQILKRLPLPDGSLWPIAFGTLGIAIVAAHVLHMWVERPVIQRLSALTDPRRPPRRLMVDA